MSYRDGNTSMGFFSKSATQAHITLAASKMLAHGGHPSFVEMGQKKLQNMLTTLSSDYRAELDTARQTLAGVYPTTMLNIAGVIQLAGLLLRDRPEVKRMAIDMLAVSTVALQESKAVGLSEIADSLLMQIRGKLMTYEPELLDEAWGQLLTTVN